MADEKVTRQELKTLQEVLAEKRITLSGRMDLINGIFRVAKKIREQAEDMVEEQGILLHFALIQVIESTDIVFTHKEKQMIFCACQE
jgi:hypothetical protein